MCIIRMNKSVKKIVLVISAMLLFFAAQAQGSRSPLEDVVNAIKSNRVSDMVKYFDNQVPITINNNQSIYSHNQAEVVLRDFFEKNNARDFVVMDNGSPDNASKFIIGTYIATNGNKYNVYMLMKLKSNAYYLLQDIRFNKE